MAVVAGVAVIGLERFSDRGYVKGMVLLSAGVVVLSEVEQCRFMMASGADRLECHSRG
ncbi:MAG: hypothetical protein ACU0AX_05105 [Roseovarius sp.]|uniref:hypothetical protein n=1 Tax=Roseovarius sp. TaxID=1486281 RepID=UPI004058E22D